MGFDMKRTFGEEISKNGIAFSDMNRSIVQRLKAFWAEQGDYLSKQYVGTNSTISKVSRDGKEGLIGKFQHKMKNVHRYIINTLSENPAQDSIDIILGRHAKSVISSEMKNYLTAELKRREDLFTEIQTLKLYVGNWNLGGVRTYDSIDISQWLLPFKETFIPDILVVGF